MTGKRELNAHLWERDPDDWYVEPEWCDAGLFAREAIDGPICDPFCGMGRILDAAQDAGHPTLGGDLHDRGARRRHPVELGGFFDVPAYAPRVDNIVTNPPYGRLMEVVPRCVAQARHKAAFLLRAQWANGSKASALLESLPLRRVLALSPRPSMPPGRVILAGISPGGGRVDYSWFIFEHGWSGPPEFGWVRRSDAAGPGRLIP